MEKRFPHLWMLFEGLPSYQIMLKFGIILGVFILSIIVAVRPTSRMTMLLAVLPFAVTITIIFLRHLALGLLAVVGACFLLPNFLGSGGMGATLSPPVLLILMVIGLWIINIAVRHRRKGLVRSRTVLPGVVFIVVTLIAFFNGQINYYVFAQTAPITAQIGGLLVFLLSIVAFFTAANLIDDLKWLQRFTWLFIVLGAFYILGSSFYPVGRFFIQYFQYGSTGSLFWIWMVSIATSQALFNSKLDKRWRWALIGLLVAIFSVSIGQSYSWKSGWLPPLIAVFVIVWIGIPRFRIAGSILAGAAVLFNSFDKLGGLVSGGEDYSIMTRTIAWRIVLELAKVNPLLGLGMANYYWYTPLIPILGYSVRFNSHNNYVDIIAQTGLIGLVCFLWFAFEVGRVGWELREKVPDGFAKAYVVGALGGLIATLFSGMLGDWILPFVYNVGFNGFRASLMGWLFLGGLVALEGMYLAGRNLPAKG
jgi:O-antigen ligase